MGIINFVLIGARNTGKTCYLSVLATHSSQIASGNDETTEYLKTQMSLIEKGDLPQATASVFRNLDFKYNSDKFKVNFSIDDYDGSFIESLSQNTEEIDSSKVSLKKRIQESEGLLFLMPYEIDHNPETLHKFETEINTIISLAEEITQNQQRKLLFPACICITKWDRSPDFKKENEAQAAQNYLQSIPAYQRAVNKINNLFEHSSVFTISAFGKTKDGSHPTKGAIDSYHLSSPFEYCLEHLFDIFDKRINSLKESQDNEALFPYLSQLFEDLFHYKEGEYCQLFNQMEQQYFEQIKSDIKTNKQLNLTEAQALIFQHFKGTKHITEINNLLKKNYKSKINKRIIAFLSFTATMYLGLSAYNTWQLNKKLIIENSEYQILTNQLEKPNIPILELLPKINAFTQKWSAPQLPEWQDKITIKYFYPSFLNKINTLNTTADEKIRQQFKTFTNNINTDKKPNINNLNNINLFCNDIESWQNISLVKKITTQCSALEQSNQLFQDITTINTLDDANLQDYSKLKDRLSHAAYTWSVENELLEKLYQNIRTQIINQSHQALISKMQLDLEESSDLLALLDHLPDPEVQTLLHDKVMPALKQATLDNKFNTLIERITTTKPENIASLLNQDWDSEFSEIQNKHLKASLQIQIAKYEKRSLPSIETDIESQDNLTNLSNKLNNITNNTRVTLEYGQPIKFSFKYQRPDTLQEKVISLQNKISFFHNAINHGINIRLPRMVDIDEDISIACLDGYLNNIEDTNPNPDDNATLRCTQSDKNIHIYSIKLNQSEEINIPITLNFSHFYGDSKKPGSMVLNKSIYYANIQCLTKTGSCYPDKLQVSILWKDQEKNVNLTFTPIPINK